MSKRERIINVHSTSLRNEKMNIRGVDLKFDDEGVCHNVDFEIAKLIAPMHGFRVEGLDDDQREEAEEHLDNVNAGRATAVEQGKVRVRGVGTVEKKTKRAFVTSPVGREPGEPVVANPGERISNGEEEDAPKKVKIKGKKKHHAEA